MQLDTNENESSMKPSDGIMKNGRKNNLKNAKFDYIWNMTASDKHEVLSWIEHWSKGSKSNKIKKGRARSKQNKDPQETTIKTETSETIHSPRETELLHEDCHSLEPSPILWIYGPPGSGKTSLALYISTILCDIQMYRMSNSSFSRSKKSVSDIFTRLQNENTIDNKNKKKTGLLIDDINTMNSSDRGALNALLEKYISTSSVPKLSEKERDLMRKCFDSQPEGKKKKNKKSKIKCKNNTNKNDEEKFGYMHGIMDDFWVDSYIPVICISTEPYASKSILKKRGIPIISVMTRNFNTLDMSFIVESLSRSINEQQKHVPRKNKVKSLKKLREQSIVVIENLFTKQSRCCLKDIYCATNDILSLHNSLLIQQEKSYREETLPFIMKEILDYSSSLFLQNYYLTQWSEKANQEYHLKSEKTKKKDKDVNQNYCKKQFDPAIGHENKKVQEKETTIIENVMVNDSDHVIHLDLSAREIKKPPKKSRLLRIKQTLHQRRWEIILNSLNASRSFDTKNPVKLENNEESFYSPLNAAIIDDECSPDIFPIYWRDPTKSWIISAALQYVCPVGSPDTLLHHNQLSQYARFGSLPSMENERNKYLSTLSMFPIVRRTLEHDCSLNEMIDEPSGVSAPRFFSEVSFINRSCSHLISGYSFQELVSKYLGLNCDNNANKSIKETCSYCIQFVLEHNIFMEK